MDKTAVLISGGIGDAITHLSRLPDLCKKENISRVDVFITGGLRVIMYIVADLCKLSDNVRDVFIDSGISSNYKLFNWLAADGLLKYNIQIPYKINTLKENEKFAYTFLNGITNPVIVNPYTLSGNPHAVSEKYARSGKEEFWCFLIRELENNKFTPIVIGGIDDEIDWKYYGCNPIVLYREFDYILDSISLIQNSIATIGTDSWPWEVSYCANKPTVSINLLRHYWFDLHLGKNTDNLLIYREVPKVEDIINFLNGRI